jgi:hypothetical protein
MSTWTNESQEKIKKSKEESKFIIYIHTHFTIHSNIAITFLPYP